MFYLRDVLLFTLFVAALALSSQSLRRVTTSLGMVEALVLGSGFLLGVGALLTWLLGATLGTGAWLPLCFFIPCLALWFWAGNTAGK
jgi:hypothetical protein